MLTSHFLDQFDYAIAKLSEAFTKRVIRRRMAKYEKAFIPLFRRYFQDQGAFYSTVFRRATQSLQEADSSQDWIKLFSSTELTLTTRYAPRIIALLQKTFASAANDAIKDHKLQLSFNLKNPRAVTYAEQRATELLRELDTATKEEIKQLIIGKLAAGESYQSVARSIIARFADYAKVVPSGKHIRNRAELVAITEAAFAYQAANFQMIKGASDTGLSFRKHWVTVGDNRVSPGCQANNGEGYIKLDDTFTSGHMYPPRFPGCRCSAVYEREK